MVVQYNFRPHGLTFDNRALWATDFDASLIWQIDPATGRQIRSIPV